MKKVVLISPDGNTSEFDVEGFEVSTGKYEGADLVILLLDSREEQDPKEDAEVVGISAVPAPSRKGIVKDSAIPPQSLLELGEEHQKILDDLRKENESVLVVVTGLPIYKVQKLATEPKIIDSKDFKKFVEDAIVDLADLENDFMVKATVAGLKTDAVMIVDGVEAYLSEEVYYEPKQTKS